MMMVVETQEWGRVGMSGGLSLGRREDGKSEGN